MVSARSLAVLSFASIYSVKSFIQKPHCPRHCCHCNASFQSPSQQSSSIRPVFVDTEIASLAANLALHVFEVFAGSLTIPKEENEKKGSSPRKRQPVYMIGPKTEQLISQEDSVILHLSKNPVRSGFFKKLPQLRHAYPVGLHVSTAGKFDWKVFRDEAQTCGTTLQHILQLLPLPSDPKFPTALVSMDAPLHLAMLEANCLPKIIPESPHTDSYYIMLRNGDTIMIDYNFKHDNFGGDDPLSCPTKDILIETSPTAPSSGRSLAQSAAYTTFRGNGLDSLWSAALAASVATTLGDSNFQPKEEFSWFMVERIIQLGRNIRQHGTKERPGLMRQTYKSYGYK